MRATIRALGNSSGVLIPKPILAELAVAAGDVVDLSLDQGRIVLTPIRRGVREGWAEAAAQIAAAGDDARGWPDMATGEDAAWEWGAPAHRACRCEARSGWSTWIPPSAAKSASAARA